MTEPITMPIVAFCRQLEAAGFTVIRNREELVIIKWCKEYKPSVVKDDVLLSPAEAEVQGWTVMLHSIKRHVLILERVTMRHGARVITPFLPGVGSIHEDHMAEILHVVGFDPREERLAG